MKKVEAIIKPFKLDEVKDKLNEIGVKGRGIANWSQLFKTTLFLVPKVMGKMGAPVIPASCTDPG